MSPRAGQLPQVATGNDAIPRDGRDEGAQRMAEPWMRSEDYVSGGLFQTTSQSGTSHSSTAAQSR